MCTYLPIQFYLCPTCQTTVTGIHICTGTRLEADVARPLVRLADEDIERIAQRIAELVSPKARAAEV